VFAWITSYLLTGETLSPRAAGGAGLILAGVLAVEMKPVPPREHRLN
jgi:drug/metabolite transporter (DMT)-like permease